MGEDLWADDWLQLHHTDLGEWHFIHLTGLGRPCQGDPQRLVCGPGTYWHAAMTTMRYVFGRGKKSPHANPPHQASFERQSRILILVTGPMVNLTLDFGL